MNLILALQSLGIENEFLVNVDCKTEEEYLHSFRDLTDQNRFISWTEVQAKMIELRAEYDSNQYQRDRAAAYPSWQDQLDNIFHNGIDAWKADIQAIKDQFPKP